MFDHGEPATGLLRVDEEAVPAPGRRPEDHARAGPDDLRIAHVTRVVRRAPVRHSTNLVGRCHGVVRAGSRPAVLGRRPRVRPGDAVARDSACPRSHGAALRDALLLHRRPRLTADHQPLPGGVAGDPRRVARTGVRRARLQLDARRAGLVQRDRHAARGDRGSAGAGAQIPRGDEAVRLRAGAGAGAPHQGRRVLGFDRALPRAGPAALRRPRAGVPARRRPCAGRGSPPRAAHRPGPRA